MKGLLLFLGLAVASVSSAFDPGFRVKFNIGLRPGVDFFFDVPRTVTAAIEQQWTQIDRPAGPRSSLVLYCYSDRVICGLYDDNGFVAGLQVAVRKDEFTESVLDWHTQGFKEWVLTSSTGEVTEYWAIQQYFVSEEYLQLSADKRRDNYNSSKLLQEDAVWFTGFNGVVDKVSSKTSDIEKSIFTRQSCIPWMGRHFYYNMSESTLCQSDTLYPWFTLVHSGELVATGLILYGKLPVNPDQRDWFERPPTLINELTVRVIVPKGPECMYKMAEDPGRITMHIYYIDKPWTLGCLKN